MAPNENERRGRWINKQWEITRRTIEKEKDGRYERKVKHDGLGEVLVYRGSCWMCEEDNWSREVVCDRCHLDLE